MGSITLFGKNAYGLAERKKALLSEFTDKYPDLLGLEQFDAMESEQNRIIDGLTTMPFLSGERLVVVRDASQNSDLADMLPKVLDRIPDSTTAVFVDPLIKKTSPLYKSLAKAGSLEEFLPPTPAELRQWLADYVKLQGGTITPGARDRLLEDGADQFFLTNEVNKLIAYDKTITEITVDLLTESELKSSVFEMLDQLMAGRVVEALKTIRALRKNRIELPYLMAMLGWQLQLLATVHLTGNKSQSEVAAQTGFSPFSLRKSESLARRLTRQQLVEATKTVWLLDRDSKRKSMDVDGALEATILRLSQIFA